MPTGYTITAGPSEFWGSHTFYSDQSLVIRENVRPAAGHGKQQRSWKVTRASRREAVRWISLIAVAGIAIVAVIASAALPKLNMARDSAEESSAIKSLQTLNTAQVQYNSQYGRYARSLAELGPSGANLISAELAACEKQGYKFKLTSTRAGYTTTAAPLAFPSSRMRMLHSDQSLVIRANN
jgi:hypothetical protein